MFVVAIALFLIFNINAWALEIKSSAFDNGGNIPPQYTCDSLNVSPPFVLNNVPSGTKSFVIIGDDPDAPFGTWVHWVIFNIPPDTKELKENFSQKAVMQGEIIQGLNDFGSIGYGGPCPPPGKPHRYFFKLYALDNIIALDENATKKDVLKAIEGHILAETRIMGFYKR